MFEIKTVDCLTNIFVKNEFFFTLISLEIIDYMYECVIFIAAFVKTSIFFLFIKKNTK